jgi:hypothetical protein
MVLLRTVVAVGKRSDKPMHGKNGSGEKQGNGKSQDSTDRLLHYRIGIERA